VSPDPLQHGNALVSRILDEHIQHLRFRRRFDHDYLARPDDRHEGVQWQEFAMRAFHESVPLTSLLSSTRACVFGGVMVR
jgi:hypothetical protein